MLQFPDTMSPYEKLKKKMRLGAHIAHIKRVLEWDRSISMPRGVAASRAQDHAFLSALAQEGFTNAEVGKWIEEARQEQELTALDPWDARNFEMIVARYRYARLIPAEAVRDRAEKKEHCFVVYGEARAQNSWKHVEPAFEQMFHAYLECAKRGGEALGISAYDYQLARYARHASVATIDPLFRLLKTEIPPLVRRIAATQKEVDILPIQVSYEQQRRVAEQVIGLMGFDFNHGFLALSSSAFSSGWRQDARIATRYEPGTLKTIFSAVHEAGHAIYKQNLPAAWQDQPVGNDSDKMLHESQALLFEKHIAFSRSGLTLIHGLLAKEDPVFGRAYSAAEFVLRMRQVKAGLVRIHADQVTYPLHIVMRYEIERDLFAEKIAVRDIPEVWREKTKAYFGLDVPDDLSGCLQDRHWFRGMFGYFPTYAQGAVYAAQMFDALCRHFPDIDAMIERGEILPLKDWLATHIHQWGQFYEAPELVRRATGAAPDARYLLDHLSRRYLRQRYAGPAAQPVSGTSQG